MAPNQKQHQKESGVICIGIARKRPVDLKNEHQMCITMNNINKVNKLIGAICWVVLYFHLIYQLLIENIGVTYLPMPLIAYNLSYEIVFSVVFPAPSGISRVFYRFYVVIDVIYFVAANLTMDWTSRIASIQWLFIFFVVQYSAIVALRCLDTYVKVSERSVRYIIIPVYVVMDMFNLYHPASIWIIAQKTIANLFYAMYCFFKNREENKRINKVFRCAAALLFVSTIFSCTCGVTFQSYQIA
eukprot:461165_1